MNQSQIEPDHTPMHANEQLEPSAVLSYLVLVVLQDRHLTVIASTVFE